MYYCEGRVYSEVDAKMAVYRKHARASVPVCSCFGHTRADLEQAVLAGHAENIPCSIQAHIKVIADAEPDRLLGARVLMAEARQGQGSGSGCAGNGRRCYRKHLISRRVPHE